MDTKRDWQGLDQKLRAGKPFDVAVSEMGIPLEEALAWANSRLPNTEGLSYSLRAVAESSLETALVKLTEIANQPPRERVEEIKKHATPGTKVTLHHTDLEAAKALAKVAIDVLRLGGGTGAKSAAAGVTRGGATPLDLFDGPGNWELTKPGN